jgi:hypothetical protein
MGGAERVPGMDFFARREMALSPRQRGKTEFGLQPFRNRPVTAGLVMSFGLMRERYGVLVRPDPKIAWSILVWVVYLGLMVARLRFHQAGHRLAWGALGGFLFVVLTFWGTNLLSPIHHP